MAPTRLLSAFAVLLAASCGEKPAEVATDAAAPPRAHSVGRTLFYTRSNQDGAKPERIVIHIVSPTELRVAKMVAPCTDAAYVTATFDAKSGEATRLVGGRLQHDGSQLPQAWLTFDPKTRKLDVRLGDPSSIPVETHDAPPAPWRMYDFDLAEFALFGPRGAEPFDFGLALVWPEEPPLLRVLGSAHAAPMDSGIRAFAPYSPPDEPPAEWADSRPFTLYAVTGPAFGADSDGGGGFLWLHPEEGYVLEATLTLPNHPGYDDFMLKLDRIDLGPNGEGWDDAIAAHWKDC